MGIIDPGNGFQCRNEKTGNNSVEINSTNQVSFFRKKTEEKFCIVFSIKTKTFSEETFNSMLFEAPGLRFSTIMEFHTNQVHLVAGFRQGAADTDHALISAEI